MFDLKKLEELSTPRSEESIKKADRRKLEREVRKMFYKHGYEDAIDKACEWLRINMPYGYDVEHGIDYPEIDLDEFRKAMEEN